ncbi:MAG: hypothetical protein ABGX16_11095 [Pirellulales bacterium]
MKHSRISPLGILEMLAFVCCRVWAASGFLRGMLPALVVGALFFGNRACASYIVGGDPIGPDSSFTDNTGGFTAVQDGNDNLGHPAILIPLTGEEILLKLRMIVFGLPSSSGNLLFDQFDYRLDFWQSDAYFDGTDPGFSIVLGDPINVGLIQSAPTSIVPETPFGNAGPFGDDAITYDLRFDLMIFASGDPTQQILTTPLAAGDWVVGFQSLHSSVASGVLRLTGSSAPVGPLPLFSRGDRSSRGILGGQDPDNIALRWGMSISVRDTIPGDYNLDRVVDGIDLAIWEDAYGPKADADVDEDGDSDGADFLVWQRFLGVELNVATVAGDYNWDSVVSDGDLAIWESSFSIDGGADADEDGDSDGADFLVWQRNRGVGAAGIIASTVPEPDAILLMIAHIFPLFLLRRPKSFRG